MPDPLAEIARVRQMGEHMSTAWIITIIIIVVLAGVAITLYILGKRAQKKQDEQAVQMAKSAQTITCFVIDKKKMRLKHANMPKVVMDAADWRTKLIRVPVVKVKAGPKVMTLICDGDVFKTLAPNQEIKASVSGMYINSAKRIRGPVVEPSKRKKKTENFLDKLR